MKTVVILAQVLFVIVLIYMMVRESIKVYKLRKKYFAEFWNGYELFVIAVCISAIAMFGLREVWGRLVLSEIGDNKGNVRRRRIQEFIKYVSDLTDSYME